MVTTGIWLLLALAAPYHVRGEDRTVGRGIGVAS